MRFDRASIGAAKLDATIPCSMISNERVLSTWRAVNCPNGSVDPRKQYLYQPIDVQCDIVTIGIKQSTHFRDFNTIDGPSAKKKP